MSATLKRFLAAVFLASLGLASGCQTSPPFERAVRAIGAETLVMAAWRTHAHYIRDHRDAPGESVPASYWEEPLRQLKPLRVYLHRVNVVVVLRENRQGEEGLYLCIPISSYAPMESQDGFTWTRLDRDVLAYRRARP